MRTVVLPYHTWQIRQDSPADWTPFSFITGHTYKSEFSQRIKACCSSSVLKEDVSEVAQLCLTLCDPMGLPSFSIHGVFQPRRLEWGAVSFSRGSSPSRDRHQVSGIAGDALPSEPPEKPITFLSPYSISEWLSGTESAATAGAAGDMVLFLSREDPPGGNSNPLQYSCLENPLDRGAWQATVHGVTKSQTQLRD